MPKWDQSLGEELANSISHGVGLLAALVGAPDPLVAAWRGGDRFFFIGTAIFTAAMLLVYLGSTLYHAWPRGTVKSAFQVIDHSAIFLLIAGTYTPFTLGPLRGAWGWTILALVWTLAIFGVILKSVHGTEQRKKLSMTLYLGMGWLILIAFRPLDSARAASQSGLAGRWRHRLHRRRFFLCQQTPSLHAFRLAFVCAPRHRLPLSGCLLLRRRMTTALPNDSHSGRAQRPDQRAHPRDLGG